MAYTPEQRAIISEALKLYKDEVSKLMKKAEKLGRKEAQSFKQLLLDTEQLRGNI